MDNSLYLWIFNGIYCLMWVLVLNSTLTYRFSRTYTYISELVWYILHIFITTMLPFMSVLKLVVAILGFVIFCLCIYKDPWSRTVFSAAMVQLVVITNELLGTILYFPPEMMAGEFNALPLKSKLMLHIPYLATGAVLFFLLYLFLNRYRYRLNPSEWLLFALFPLSQYILMFGWLDSLRLTGSSGRVFFFLIVVAACIAADIGLLFAVLRIAQRAQLVSENSQLAAQIEAQEKHYADLTTQYENIRHMRHDIANHLNAMQSMLKNGCQCEAANYLSELTAHPYDTSLGLCENPVVDAFLHNRIESAKAIGININALISVRADISISNVDLIRAFGNLLDNAIEACSDIGNAEISVSCIEAKGCLVIKTENPALEKTKEKRRRIPELERGIGTRVLLDLAEKYDGMLKREKISGMYKVELILRLI